VELDVIVGVVNVEMGVEMVMLKELVPAGILPNPLHPINNTPNNQSKPIVQSLFPHLL
jgi:hypothetical protein